MRTHEQVVADVERRFRELKEEKRKHDEEMAKPKHTKPCQTCRHLSLLDNCQNPLMKDIKTGGGWDVHVWPERLQLCKGKLYNSEPEQALWEPRLKWWQKIINRVKGE